MFDSDSAAVELSFELNFWRWSSLLAEKVDFCSFSQSRVLVSPCEGAVCTISELMIRCRRGREYEIFGFWVESRGAICGAEF